MTGANKSRITTTVIVALIGIVIIAVVGRQNNENNVTRSNEVGNIAPIGSKESDTTPTVADSSYVPEPETKSFIDPGWPEVRETKPATLYAKYLPMAEQGDVNAAFVLVTALGECRHAVKSEQELETIAASAGFSEDVLKLERENHLRCKSLFDQVLDVNDEYDKWYSTTKQADHPLFLVKQQNRSYEETRALVLSALSHNYPEPRLYKDIFLAAARLHKNYPENGIDENQFFAWQLLACSVSSECDHGEFSRGLMENYPSSQTTEIFSLESALSDAMRLGRFSDLGF